MKNPFYVALKKLVLNNIFWGYILNIFNCIKLKIFCEQPKLFDHFVYLQNSS